jgi:hypothetical protein
MYMFGAPGKLLSAALAVRVFFSPYRNHKTHGSEGVKD